MNRATESGRGKPDNYDGGKLLLPSQGDFAAVNARLEDALMLIDQCAVDLRAAFVELRHLDPENVELDHFREAADTCRKFRATVDRDAPVDAVEAAERGEEVPWTAEGRANLERDRGDRWPGHLSAASNTDDGSSQETQRRAMNNYAEFETIREPSEHPAYSTKVTRCTVCGWETHAQNRETFGSPNSLSLELLAHRLDHIEGRV